MKTLYSIDDFDSMYCDGLLTKENRLLFGSFWGRDTTALEFLSKFQLPVSQGGLAFTQIGGVLTYVDADHLHKQTGRVSSSIFGNLVHLWLYHDGLVNVDTVNHRSLTLLDQVHTPETLPQSLLWPLIKSVSPFPLLDDWQTPLVNECIRQECVDIHTGLNMSCVEISLDEMSLGEFLTAGIASGELSSEVAHD